MKYNLNLIEEGLLDLCALFCGADHGVKDDITRVPKVLCGNPLSDHTDAKYSELPKGIETPKEFEKRDLLGELTTSFIIDGLDVTRKDTLLMVLFDNRLRASLGEKTTHRINLVCR